MIIITDQADIFYCYKTENRWFHTYVVDSTIKMSFDNDTQTQWSDDDSVIVFAPLNFINNKWAPWIEMSYILLPDEIKLYAIFI